MKFKNRIIAAITISSVMFNIIFGFFIIKKEMKTEKERLNSKIDHYNTLLENINTGSLWDFDADKIKTNLNIIYSDPEVNEIQLNDATLTINILLQKKKDLKDSLQIRHDIKIIKNDIQLGNTYIVYSRELYTTKLYMLIAEKLFLTLGLILINIIAVYFISGHLLKPIDSVIEALKEIDSGNRSARLSIGTGDEFSEIEKYFNKMASTIQNEIDARAEREKQLNDMHQYLSSLFDSIPSILISVDTQGNIRSINSAAESFSGMNSSDILDKGVFEIFPLLNEFRDDINRIIESKSGIDVKSNYRSPDGERYIEISISSLYHGGITGAVIRMDDITVIKKKDEKLNQAQMMDSIGNLAGGIAHDFNNVLSGITGTVSLLKYRLSKNELDDNDLNKFLNVIDDSGKRAVSLTKQILSLSRKDEMTMEPADLNDILRHVYNFCFHSFDKSIDIKVNYYNGPARATVDPTRLEQVFLNLCINAGDAMTVMRPDNERRGGILNIEIKKFPGTGYSGTSPVETETGKDYWKITIEDNGIGIDKQTMEKIFEPFFTTKAKGRGTGLGLAMVYNITHMHNGFINVDSEPGRGSSFSLFIPVDESGTVQREELQCNLKAGSGRILVIDDEESICETSRELLDYCGYEVTVECNPELALKRYSEAKIAFDCVILDLNMPKKNGFEVLQHLKAEFPDSKIIISSGSIGDEKMKTLSAAGAVAFITKPYTLESLAKTVADVIASV